MWMRGVNAEIDALHQTPLETEPAPEKQEPPAAQRLRFRIGRFGEARFLSNREWMAAWVRALRRAKFPLSYSQGFHAHPKVTFSTAPAVGEESECDYMDVILRSPLLPDEALQRLANCLPSGLRVFEADVIPLKTQALMAAVTGFSYALETKEAQQALEARARAVLSRERIEIEREGKKNRRGARRTSVVDVRPMIKRMAVRPASEGATLDLEVRRVDSRGVRLREILALLGLDPAAVRIIKRATYLSEDE
jgi:radical SAM-linked protein